MILYFTGESRASLMASSIADSEGDAQSAKDTAGSSDTGTVSDAAILQVSLYYLRKYYHKIMKLSGSNS